MSNRWGFGSIRVACIVESRGKILGKMSNTETETQPLVLRTNFSPYILEIADVESMCVLLKKPGLRGKRENDRNVWNVHRKSREEEEKSYTRKL